MKKGKNKNLVLNRVDVVGVAKRRAKELEEGYKRKKRHLAQNTV